MESIKTSPGQTDLSDKLCQILPQNKDEFLLSEVENLVNLWPSILSSLKQTVDAFYQRQYEKSYWYSDALIDIIWEKLNTGNWKDVDITWRKAYSYASVFKLLSYFKRKNMTTNSVEIAEGIKICDMAMLMGITIHNDILQRIVEILQSEIAKNQLEFVQGFGDSGVKRGIDKRLKRGYSPPNKDEDEPKAKLPVSFSARRQIARLSCPSLESFRRQNLSSHKPVILTNCVDHWPAFNERKWSIEYIKRVAGARTVPIEIGSRYTDSDWSQKLMTIAEFIDKYIFDSNHVGYLAQHQLFNQIPELEKDILPPDYCFLGADDDIDVNAWFGPKGTISPLHYDPKENFLVQVLGEKYIRLYEENNSVFVYPFPDKLLFNTSQVDVENANLEKFPEFSKAEYLECVLRPGEMLYIPPRCWHYVRSLSVSFSVSFWWIYSDKYPETGDADLNIKSVISD